MITGFGLRGYIMALDAMLHILNSNKRSDLNVDSPLSAKDGILIVEMAREGRLVHRKSIREAPVEAWRSRFRPILMTFFALELGAVPLVLATGADARISLGLSVLSGIIASTCLAVLFVP